MRQLSITPSIAVTIGCRTRQYYAFITTYFLLQALAKPGAVSVEDVYAYLKTQVPEAVRRDKNESQHPNIARSRDRVEIYLRESAGSKRPQ